MNNIKGSKLIKIASVLLIITAIISIPILCFLIRELNPYHLTRRSLDFIELYGALAALVYQVPIVITGICGLILHDETSKYRILLGFGITTLILAVLISMALVNHAYMLSFTIIILIAYIKGAFDNRATLLENDRSPTQDH
ncbi:MAG: hypothetical protein VB009_06975 [Erysipelotrichaceae bacterium]|nr:hypothetical protein [Erysipelotrichaceae bacterium]